MRRDRPAPGEPLPGLRDGRDHALPGERELRAMWPCFFGLRALADACTRISEGTSDGHDLQRLQRWAAEVAGRGSCRHPDGAVIFLASSLDVFAREFAHHTAHNLRRSA